MNNTPVIGLYLWCIDCLARCGDGESARHDLSIQGRGDTAPAEGANIQDAPYYEAELTCSHCGSDQFLVNVIRGGKDNG